MRTIPTAISNGFANGYRMFWLVKLQASGGNTFYWTTASKNRQGNVMTLKETASGPALTYDSKMIAAEIDGEEVDGIGPMESGANIYDGGGVGYVSDLEIVILNQERFDQTVVSQNINIENRPIQVYLGFIPDGASPVVVIADDMLLRWSGVVEDSNLFDYSEYRLRCVDGSFQQHKQLPQQIINENDYPFAPVSAIGQVLPIVYGDFALSTMQDDILLETHSPAPSILVNEVEREFVFSSHEMHTMPSGFMYFLNVAKFYTYDGTLNVFPIIASTNITVTNGPSGATAKVNDVPVKVDVYFQPKAKGDLTGSAVTNYQDAVDKSLATYVTLQNAPNETTLYLRPSKVPSAQKGDDTWFAWSVQFGNIYGAGSGRLKYQKDGTPAGESTTFSDADANNTVHGSIPFSVGPEDIADFQFGLEIEFGSAQVKNIYLQFHKLKVMDFAAQRYIEANKKIQKTLDELL
jgi:hypothetical protein